MHQIVYVSSATNLMSIDELQILLEQSRERNNKLSVTGILLYLKGAFIQVLEGDEADVDAVYASIRKDKRNTNHYLIIKEQINERAFPDWTMGFSYITSKVAQKLEGFTDFLEKDVTTSEIARDPNKVMRLLYEFKNANA